MSDVLAAAVDVRGARAAPPGSPPRRTALALLVAAPGAAALSLVPPKPDVLLGVSDRGSTEEFNLFAELTGKHPALMETFLGWGNSVNKAYERWRETQTRPVVAIATSERADPGRDHHPGADRARRRRRLPAAAEQLLRHPPAARLHPAAGRAEPLPQRLGRGRMRRHPENGEHSSFWYKEAFRRIVAIVRGGQTLEGINATLAELGLPPLNRTKGEAPIALPVAPVSIIWSPLPAGSPRVKGNFPGNYWPGSKWVDWVGTDFYAKYPVWDDLERFYEGAQWKNKPVAITEWAMQENDEPRFVKQLISWVVTHKRVQMLTYYQGFGAGNTYELGLYPRSTNMLRKKIRRANFLSYAEYNAGLLPPLPPKEKKP